MARGQIWDAGKYKKVDADIIERYADGQERIHFTPTPAKDTAAASNALIKTWKHCVREHWRPPAVALTAFNLDFCIHPFRDDHGPVSRLALLLQSYHAGMAVARYMSLKRLIEQSKERYDETLEHCSVGWHAGKHDPSPFINHVLSILKLAYQEFAERVGQIAEPKGAKARRVRDAVRKRRGDFRLCDIEQKLSERRQRMNQKGTRRVAAPAN